MPTRSPFPGMDPYLEHKWGNCHTHLVATTAAALNLRLPGDLSAEIEEYVPIDEDDDMRWVRRPDVYVVDDPVGPAARFGAAAVETVGGTAVVDVPVMLPAPGPFTERSIHIIDVDGDRIVTAIEFLNPWNKEPGRGRDEYLRKRAEVLDSPAHLIEVDLVRGGGPWPDMTDPFAVSQEYWTTYRAMVYRRTPDGRTAGLYPIPLHKRLPTVAVPLRPADADVSLDLQAIVDEVYAKGAGRRIRYDRDADPPLAGNEADWADRLLRAGGDR